ncbi:hypothetical protein DFR58_103255 [Anaerobacterium chartisolvens]|uniref:N-acetyltransferase domain-containing protein n=1 Tax=Anaerobacterium chartisolvens TaxID=1297424 RepID=A0A369BFX5_9FIRM|nr:hypothetical protein [Anaerobacterium chartisolvens]RCX19508.1 hypothetical protein DFR58_103255 [Anaerobacterium chartisolvens]
MIKLETPRLKGEFLVCKNKDIPLIKLPKDCIIGRKAIQDYDFRYGIIDGVEHLVATNKRITESIELLPAYNVKSMINYDNHNISIVIRSAIDESDYCIGNSIIESNHYLKPPNKGMMILVEIESDEDHEYFLEKLNQPEESTPFQKILSKSSKIIGCAIIDQLTYASPKGRIKIAEELGVDEYLISGKDANGNDLSRDIVIGLLKISWASRFAVLKLFQGIGIGTILAEHAGIVSNTKMIPPSNYIEVFTTHTKSIAQEILDSKVNSFLNKAGYNVYDKLLNSRPFFNKKEGCFIPHKKLYFYKKVGS